MTGNIADEPLGNTDKRQTEKSQNPGIMMPSFESERQEMIRAFQRCATAAERSATIAIETDGEQECIHACRDAASLCRVASELVARGSRYEMWVVPASIFAAHSCAQHCLELPGPHFAECAAACQAVIATAEGVSSEDPAMSYGTDSPHDDGRSSTRRRTTGANVAQDYV